MGKRCPLRCRAHPEVDWKLNWPNAPSKYVSSENLYRLSALVRAEIRKVCQALLPLENATTIEQ
jgi:hypothetical protein